MKKPRIAFLLYAYLGYKHDNSSMRLLGTHSEEGFIKRLREEYGMLFISSPHRDLYNQKPVCTFIILCAGKRLIRLGNLRFKGRGGFFIFFEKKIKAFFACIKRLIQLFSYAQHSKAYCSSSLPLSAMLFILCAA